MSQSPILEEGRKEGEKELMDDVYIALAVADGLKRKTDHGEEVVDDPIRSPLVRKTMRTHAKKGRKMFIVYNPNFPPAPQTMRIMKDLANKGLAILKEQSQEGIGGAQRESICIPFREYNAKVVVHQEPEKVDFAARGIPAVVKPIWYENYQSVVPRRSPASWATYYGYQIRTESRANDVLAFVRKFVIGSIGEYLDEMFGPTAFSREAEPSIWECTGTGWDAHMTPHDNIAARGGKVGSVTIDYIHPSRQTKYERTNDMFLQKRVNAMIYCINAVTQHIFTLHPNSFTKRPPVLKTLDDMAAQFPQYDWNIFDFHAL